MALALLLLVGAGLLLRSFVGLVAVDRGYDPANVVAVRTRHPDLSVGVLTPDVMDALVAEARRFQGALLDGLDRIGGLPGVAAVGLTSGLPLSFRDGFGGPVSVVGRPPPGDRGELPPALYEFVSPGYFDVMRLRLRRGCFLTHLDGAGSPRVLVVNETFAREFFADVPAVGRRVQLGRGGGGAWEVVGVVADIKYEGLSVTESRAVAFMSVHQIEAAPAVNINHPFIAVRTHGRSSRSFDRL